MFTGIIQHHGQVQEVVLKDHGMTLAVTSDVFAPNQIGKSFAINGVCLTQTKLKDNVAYFDLTLETLDKTDLGSLKENDEVHIEPAMGIGSTFDGHMVQGHADGVGELISITEDELIIRLPSELKKYVVSKGSIAIDGVSLTIAQIEDDRIKIALIPHTYEWTLFKSKRYKTVNVEIDIMAKTIFKYLKEINLQEALSQ